MATFSSFLTELSGIILKTFLYYVPKAGVLITVMANAWQFSKTLPRVTDLNPVKGF